MIALFLAEIGEHAVAAVAGKVGVDDDGAIAAVAEQLDGVPPVGRHIDVQLEALAGALDRGGDRRVVFDDEESIRHGANLGPHRSRGKLGLAV